MYQEPEMPVIDEDNLLERVRKELFEYFYNDFIIEELRLYITGRYNNGFENFNQIYRAANTFWIRDKILIDTFVEVGRESYWPPIRDMDLDKDAISKFQEIKKDCKEMFENVRTIDDEDDKYMQWFKLFKLIGPYFEDRLKEESLLPEHYTNDYQY